MWAHLAYLLIGAWAGATLGVIAMAVCTAGARADETFPATRRCSYADAMRCQNNPANYGKAKAA